MPYMDPMGYKASYFWMVGTFGFFPPSRYKPLRKVQPTEGKLPFAASPAFGGTATVQQVTLQAKGG